MTRFADLGLAEPIQRALASKGYDTPTPIQAQAIPPVLAGKDLLGIAQTGTGKTAAFALPSLHRLAANGEQRKPASCRMLILAPTRELAGQIAESFQAYGKNLRLNVQVVVGGVPIGRQARALVPGTDILVATPGRLLDLIDQRALTLGRVEILVLDEADQMLDLGFIHALRRIVTLLPRQRQTLFFSATMPKAIGELADKYLNNPIKVAVTPVAKTADKVEQYVTFVNQKEKQGLLTLKLRDPEIARALVFTRTKHGADRVVKHLEVAGVPADAIHGNKSQPQRERALAGFKDGRTRVLVATDIAARGIDVDQVSHVFNFEIPDVAEQYVHRIGRTARKGADGIAISFVDEEERGNWRAIEKLTGAKAIPLPLPEDFLREQARLPLPPRASLAPDRPPQQHRGPRRAPAGGRPAQGGRGGRGGGGYRASSPR